MRKQRGSRGRRGGQQFTYQAALQEGCGGEGREKETEKTCEKRPRAGARAPASPPPPFFCGGSSGTPQCPPSLVGQPGCPIQGTHPGQGCCGGAGRGTQPPPEHPSPSPLRAFFWSLRVSEDFFLISWRARLYSGVTEVLSEGTPLLTSAAPQHGSSPSCPYLSHGLCPAGWQFSSSPQSCPAKG